MRSHSINHPVRTGWPGKLAPRSAGPARAGVLAQAPVLARATVLALTLAAALAWTLPCADSLAQPVPALPDAAQPGRIAPAPPEPPAPRDSGPLPIAPAAPSPGAPGAEQVFFPVREVRIEGMTVYAPGSFESLTRELAGTRVSLARAEELARAITARYQRDGYLLALALVPEQALADGALRIRVIEGYVGEIRIGDEAADPAIAALARRHAEHIAAARPLDQATLERYLLLIRDLPGVRSATVLRPAASGTGAAALVLQLERRAVEAQLDLDNRGTRYAGPNRTSLSLFANGVFGAGSLTQLSLTDTRPFSQAHELEAAFVRHELPLGSDGMRAYASAARSRSRLGDTLAPLDFNARTETASIGFTHALKRSRRFNLWIGAAYEDKRIRATLLGLPFSEDRLGNLLLSARGDGADSLGGVLQASAELAFGLRDTPRNPAVPPSRVDGRSDFTRLRVELARQQTIAGGWTLGFTAGAQLANRPLLAAEKFGLGGAQLGRAYDPSEITGDRGMGLGAELAKQVAAQAQAYGFYDIGAVRDRDGTPARSLASAGLGGRLRVGQGVYASLEWAAPLTRAIAAAGGNGRGARVFFRLSVRI